MDTCAMLQLVLTKERCSKMYKGQREGHKVKAKRNRDRWMNQ